MLASCHHIFENSYAFFFIFQNQKPIREVKLDPREIIFDRFPSCAFIIKVERSGLLCFVCVSLCLDRVGPTSDVYVNGGSRTCV